MASRTTDTVSTVEDQLRARVRELEAQVERDQEIQQALEASEERFALAVLGTNDGIWDWDIASGRLHNNLRWCEILGYPPANQHRLEDFSARIQTRPSCSWVGPVTRQPAATRSSTGSTLPALVS